MRRGAAERRRRRTTRPKAAACRAPRPYAGPRAAAHGAAGRGWMDPGVEQPRTISRRTLAGETDEAEEHIFQRLAGPHLSWRVFGDGPPRRLAQLDQRAFRQQPS